ncbi:hypothetical protein D3C81_1587650 [compost metagenome]
MFAVGRDDVGLQRNIFSFSHPNWNKSTVARFLLHAQAGKKTYTCLLDHQFFGCFRVISKKLNIGRVVQTSENSMNTKPIKCTAFKKNKRLGSNIFNRQIIFLEKWMPFIHIKTYRIFVKLGRLQVRMANISDKSYIYFIVNDLSNNIIRSARR